LVTDTLPVSGLKDCLTEVDICKDFGLEIFAIYCCNDEFSGSLCHLLK
jgi:hypothetical protein